MDKFCLAKYSSTWCQASYFNSITNHNLDWNFSMDDHHKTLQTGWSIGYQRVDNHIPFCATFCVLKFPTNTRFKDSNFQLKWQCTKERDASINEFSSQTLCIICAYNSAEIHIYALLLYYYFGRNCEQMMVILSLYENYKPHS